MGNFTKTEIDADIAMLADNISSGNRIIPSNSDLLRRCFFIPVVSLILSLVSTLVFYLVDSHRYKNLYSDGFFNFLTSEGWVVIAPTVIIGLLFSFMTYNNLILYLTISNEVREKSLVLRHLKKVVKKVVVFFLGVMLLSTLLCAFIHWLAFGVPASEAALFFIVNIVVGMEINRLGAGVALEKVSNLLKKI